MREGRKACKVYKDSYDAVQFTEGDLFIRRVLDFLWARGNHLSFVDSVPLPLKHVSLLHLLHLVIISCCHLHSPTTTSLDLEPDVPRITPITRSRQILEEQDTSLTMPAVDPFSALARPYISHDFTAADRHVRQSMLQTIDPNSVPLAAPPNTVSPAIKVYKDGLPQAESHVPLWSHLRSPSATSIDRLDSLSLESIPRRQVARVESDEWMGNEISRCLDAAKAELDIKCVRALSFLESITDVTGARA